MNADLLFDALEEVDDEFILDAEEYRPAKAKGRSIMKRILIGIAAVLLLGALSLGTAMAVNEEIREGVMLFFGRFTHEELMDVYDEVYDYLSKELDFEEPKDLGDMHSIDILNLSENDDWYVVLVEGSFHNDKNNPVMITDHTYDICYVERGWFGELKLVAMESIDEAMATPQKVGVLQNKNVTIVYGSSEAVENMNIRSVCLSDGSEARVSINFDVFAAVIPGDHRKAVVSDIECTSGGDSGVYYSQYYIGFGWYGFDDPIEAVRNAIESVTENDYTLSVRVDELEIDEAEGKRMAELYSGGYWAMNNELTYEDLEKGLVAVKAKYHVEFDSEKTILPSGDKEIYYYALRTESAGQWYVQGHFVKSRIQEWDEQRAELEKQLAEGSAEN